MKTDVYTKIVLTVIAIALVANFFKGTDIVTTAQAQTAITSTTPLLPQKIDVNVVSINGMPIHNTSVELLDGTEKSVFPVRISGTSRPIEVNLKQFDGYDFYKYSSGNVFNSNGSIYGIPSLKLE